MGCTICKSVTDASPRIGVSTKNNKSSSSESLSRNKIETTQTTCIDSGLTIAPASNCVQPPSCKQEAESTTIKSNNNNNSDNIRIEATTQYKPSDNETRSAVPITCYNKDDFSNKQGSNCSAYKEARPLLRDASANSRLEGASVASKQNDHTLPMTKIPDQRNLSTCRLKRRSDISEFYDISSEVLGTGISGSVRVANHRTTNRRYAIKTLSLEGVGHKKAAMLHNEVSIYLQLDHPNIAKLIEVYETDEAIHLVMELCTGGELYHRLAASKKYSERDAAIVTQQMLSAINYCHKHRICHRDLKLENWVYADVSPDAPLKLIDFGFSRIFNPSIPMTAMHGTVYYVSPEVMDGCYQEKCDIWSIGVIVYMLLSGSPPFNGSYDHEILLKIKRGAFSFCGPRWEGISDCAKSFIRCLLQKNPDHRPSADEALTHPWLQHRQEADNHNIDLSVLQSMRQFALGNILRRAAFAVVALTMTSQEVEELEAAFRKLDRNNQGTIPLQDLANLLMEYLHIDTHEAHSIFNKIAGSREIHYTEFIASTLQAKFVQDESLIQEAFHRFDVNHRNAITLENLRSVLGDTYNSTKVEDIMALCDTNGDGLIDFEEFRKALTSDDAAMSSSSDVGIDSTAEPEMIKDSDDDDDDNLNIFTQECKNTKRDAALSALNSIRKATLH